MGMFDSYYAAKKFKCPSCGTLQGGAADDFQSKELDCTLNGYRLGAKMMIQTGSLFMRRR